MKKVRELVTVLAYIAVFGMVFVINVKNAFPSSGLSDFDRGVSAAIAPILGLFMLMGVGALIGVVMEWYEQS